MELGGKLIDRYLVKYLAKIFESQYHVNPLNNPKSVIKLYKAAETCKKNLSPENVNKIPVNIDYLYEEYDFTTNLERTLILEALLHNNFAERIDAIVKTCCSQARIIPIQLKSCEIIGGTLRIPYVKDLLRKSLNNMELSTTLNMDECIAKGCVYYTFLQSLTKENLKVYDPNQIDLSILAPSLNIKDFIKIESEMQSIDFDNNKTEVIRNDIEKLLYF